MKAWIIPTTVFLVFSLTIQTTYASGLGDANACYGAVQRGEYDEAIQACTKAIDSGDLTKELLTASYNNRGQAWLGKNQTENAIEDFSKAIDINPSYATSYYNRGNCWFKKEQYGKAVSDYTRTVELDPEDAEAYGNRGLARFNLNSLDLAISDYSRSIELDPESALNFYNRSVAYERKGLLDKAVADILSFIHYAPGDEDGTKRLESLAGKEAVLKLPPRVVQSIPHDGAADVPLNQKSITFIFNKDMLQSAWALGKFRDLPFPQTMETDNPWQTSRSFVVRLKSLEPGTTYGILLNGEASKGFQSAEHHVPLPITLFTFTTISPIMAEIQDDEADNSNAIREYTKAIESGKLSHEDLIISLNNRGLLWTDKGKYTFAIADFTRALELDSRDADMYNNRGLAWFRKGEYEQALSDYNSALEIDPSSVRVWNNRSITWFQMGNIDRTIADCTKAITLNPQYSYAYYNRGKAFKAKGEYDRAIKDYTKAIELDPSDSDNFNNRGLALHEKGKYDDALVDYIKALNLNPNHILAYFNRANTFLKLSQHDRALEDFSKAISLSPKFVQAYHNRGIAYLEMGQHEPALSDFNTTISLNPGYASAYYNRSIIYEAKGLLTKAIIDTERFVELDSEDSDGRKRLRNLKKIMEKRDVSESVAHDNSR